MKRGELKRTAFKRAEPKPKSAEPRPKKCGKQPNARLKGMKTKQRAVSAGEKLMWDRLAREIGCIACMKDGRFNPHVSIHHVDGRTKPDCHKLVLPLCAPHHQDDGSGAVAVHPWKAQFERRYGAQLALVAECMYLIGEK
jgi:hypothetical protein